MIHNPASAEQLVEYLRQKGINFADADYINIQSQLQREQLRLAGLDVDAGPANPAIAQVRTRIDLLQQKLTARYLAAVEVYLTGLQSKIDTIKARQRSELASIQMMQTVATNPQSADWRASADALDHHQMAHMAELAHIDMPTIAVLNAAQPPTGPMLFHDAIVMGYALLAGIVVGSVLGLVQEWNENRIRTPAEASRLLRMPVISVIPHMASWHSSRSRALTMQNQPVSDGAEAFRTIRTALGHDPRQSLKTLLVTSPVAGDGKSLTAANLAIAFAQAGQKTLLIDCDLRKPAQHKIFELRGDGLTSVIGRQAKLSIAIQVTEVENLSVLPAGPAVENSSELLSAKRFRRIMSVLMKVYDKIVIDAPGLIKLSDARVLAASADVTLLVLRAGETTDWQACAAVEGLRNIGAEVLGIVMNNLRRGENASGYFRGDVYNGDSVTDRRRKATTRDWQRTWKHLPHPMKMAG